MHEWLESSDRLCYSQLWRCILPTTSLPKHFLCFVLQSVLSLAKLALLASDEQPHTAEKEVCTLNTELDLVLYQEELPDVVLSSYGYDIERMRVLTPTELIKVRGQVFLDVRSLDPLKSLDLIMLACGVPMTWPVVIVSWSCNVWFYIGHKFLKGIVKSGNHSVLSLFGFWK